MIGNAAMKTFHAPAAECWTLKPMAGTLGTNE
jgi:hypothetical protein